MKHKQNEDNKVYLLSSHPEIKLIFDVSTGVNFLHVFLHIYYILNIWKLYVVVPMLNS